MKNTIAIASFLISFGFLAAVQADIVNPLRSQGDYNAIIFGDLVKTGTGDAEGYVAVGGDLTVDGNFSVGHLRKSGSSVPNNAALVVGGTITNNGAWEVKGSAYYGNLEGRAFTYTNGYGERLDNNPIDFSKLESDIRQFSSSLSQLEQTSGVSTDFNQWNKSIKVTGGGDQVLNINLSDISGMNGYGNYFDHVFNGLSINGGYDNLIINIFGDLEGLNELTIFYGFNQNDKYYTDNLLLNLINIDVLNVYNTEVFANIVGVDTHVNLYTSSINGTAVFASADLDSGSEFHNSYQYEGEHDMPPSVATPEPASMLIVGLGFGALPFVRRLRRKSA